MSESRVQQGSAAGSAVAAQRCGRAGERGERRLRALFFPCMQIVSTSLYVYAQYHAADDNAEGLGNGKHARVAPGRSHPLACTHARTHALRHAQKSCVMKSNEWCLIIMVGSSCQEQPEKHAAGTVCVVFAGSACTHIVPHDVSCVRSIKQRAVGEHT